MNFVHVLTKYALKRKLPYLTFRRNVRSFRNRTNNVKTTNSHAVNDNLQPNQNDTPEVRSLLDSSVTTKKEDVQVEFPSDVQGYWKNQHEYNQWLRDQTRHSTRPKVDPKTTSILLFPGQGSQFVGMGTHLLDYPGVPELYETASQILGYDLLSLCLNGPASELNKTIHQQPAVVVTSLAAVERLKYDRPSAIEKCVSAAGFSVGEISALVFAGALTFKDAVKLVKVRAEAMQTASEEEPSGMMTTFLRPDNRINFACLAARKFCEEKLSIEDPVCEIANFLFPECKVVAGHTQALDFIESIKDDVGISRTKRLPVSGAFHTKLMYPAKASFQQALKHIPIQDPRIPVHSNVTGKAYRSAMMIKKDLPKQLHKPVLWEQILHILYQRPKGEDFPLTFEVGPGGQLGLLLKRTNSKAHEVYESVRV